jgi:hypothetical protein
LAGQRYGSRSTSDQSDRAATGFHDVRATIRYDCNGYHFGMALNSAWCWCAEKAHGFLMLTDEQKALVDECIFLRGRIITSYSQVEFILADVSVVLDLKFPYLIGKRIKAAKEIAERPGYEAYRDELHSVCDGLDEFNDIRLFMAHGWVSAELGAEGANIIEFFRYERTGEGQFQLMRGRTDVGRLRQAADDIEQYSNRTLTLFRRIYDDKGLESNGGAQRYMP